MLNASSKALLLASLALASVVGCTNAGDGAPGDPADSEASAANGTSGGSPEGNTPPPSAVAAGAKHFATFNFQVSKPSPTTPLTYNVGALFANSDPTIGIACGAPEAVGTCMMRRCDLPTGTTVPSLDTLPPGEVVAMTPGQQRTLSVNGQGFWLPKETPLTWNPGDALTGKVSGAPGGAPAFELTTQAPGGVTMTSPTLPKSLDLAPLPHEKSQDLVATWSDATTGNVEMVVTGGAGGKVLIIQCETKATDGKISMSASLLARFDSPKVRMSLQVTSVVTKRQGDWALAVFAHAPVLTPDGRDAFTFLELQ